MKHEIKHGMIDKELRMSGAAIRTIAPYMKESTVHKMNWFCNKFQRI